MGRKIFVGNLSWNVDDQMLAEFFSEVGTVEEAVVIVDKFKGNRSKGFGFVTFSDDAAAEKAVAELDQKELDGRAVNVSAAKEERKRDDFNGGGSY